MTMKPSIEKILLYRVQKELNRLLMEISWDGHVVVTSARVGWVRNGTEWMAHAVAEFQNHQEEAAIRGPSLDCVGDAGSMLAFELATKMVAAMGSDLGTEQIKASRERRVMVECPECHGQGWLGEPGTSYQEQCQCCLGGGKLTAQALFQWEDENSSTLARLQRRRKKAFWS